MQSNHGQFRFGGFEICLKAAQLRKTAGGAEIRLAPQPFQLLVLLVSRAGELVTRDEIRAALWSDGTTVEFDLGVNFCIRQIRIALQDNPREPQYVATIPKKGYRFLQPVAPVADDCGTGGPPLPRLPRNPDALRPFREAEHLAVSWELPRVQRAVQLYREVIQLDPAFPDAYAALANTLALLPLMGGKPAAEEAESLARTAIAMDESLSLAHIALGHVSFHQWKWNLAETEFRRALQLDSQSASGHQLYAILLATQGRFTDAVEHGRKAAELEPTAGVILYALAHIYFHAGLFDEAIRQHHHTLNMARHYPISYASLLRAHAMKASWDEVEKVLDEWESVSGPAASGPWRAYWLAGRGRTNEARAAFAAWTSRVPHVTRNPLSTAIVQLAMGDAALAIDTLQDGVRQRTPAVLWLRVAPELAALQADPRFQILLAQMDHDETAG